MLKIRPVALWPLALMVASVCWADVITWTGAAGNQWIDENNWDPHVIPNAYLPNDHHAIIGWGSAVVLGHSYSSGLSTGADILDVGAGASLLLSDPSYDTKLHVITTLNNAGEIVLGGTHGAQLTVGDFPAPGHGATFTGGGAITLSNPLPGNPGNNVSFGGYGSAIENLTLAGQTIQGTGVISGFNLSVSSASRIVANNAGTTLFLDRSVVDNQGIIQATNGANLSIYTFTAITNGPGAQIQALGDGSTATLLNGSISGGTFVTSGTGRISIGHNDQGGGSTVLQNIDNTGNLVVEDYAGSGANVAVLIGTIDNTGSITLAGSNSGLSADSAGVALSGNGTLTSNGGNIGGGPLVSYNTIQGSVNHGSGSLTNLGTVHIGNGETFDNAPGASFDNQGVLRIDAGGTMSNYWQNAAPNVVNGTLTGGTFDIAGVWQGVGSNPDSPIVRNAATLILDGPGSAVYFNGGTRDGLAQFNDNQASGSFTIRNGRDFVTSGAFQNSGLVDIGAASAFQAGPDGSLQAYTQTGGSTVVNGTLTASALDIQGGRISGSGVIEAGMLMGGTLNPGTSPGAITVHGNYTQTSSGILEMEIASVAPGGFDQLIVEGDLSLDGILRILLAGYNPHNNDQFQILSWTGGLTLAGGLQYQGFQLGGGYEFTRLWGAHDLTLQVTGGPNGGAVPEPAAWQLLLLGLGGCVFGLLHRRISRS